MSESGAQNPPGHAASCDCSAAGTRDAARQWEPAHAGEHAGNVVGSTMGGPVYGHARIVGGCFGASHAMEQAPVGAVGSLAVGSKHGAQRSSAWHVDWGRTATSEATSGMHVDRQRPSDPATDVHVAGTAFPPLAMSESGAQ
jgi:hypothetical protein